MGSTTHQVLLSLCFGMARWVTYALLLDESTSCDFQPVILGVGVGMFLLLHLEVDSRVPTV